MSVGREGVAQDPSPGCVIGFPCTELNAGFLFLSRIKDGFLNSNNTLFLLWKETGRVLKESQNGESQTKGSTEGTPFESGNSPDNT